MVSLMHGIWKIDIPTMSDFQKIVIPVIRNVGWITIADIIISVQPMAKPTNSLFHILKNRHVDYEYILFKGDPIISNMIVVHTAIRPFMRNKDPEPNEHYRPWMEEHIGKQGVDWNWKIYTVVNNELAIDFADKEQATLFELTWP